MLKPYSHSSSLLIGALAGRMEIRDDAVTFPCLPEEYDAMVRSLPIVREGGWYHVVNRGVDGSALFPTAGTTMAFVDELGRVARRFRVEIHAYCVMGNHYHLLARAM